MREAGGPGDGVKAMLSRPIQLAGQLAKAAAEATPQRPECAELGTRADRLAALLRQTARADTLYDRPAARILGDATQALSKALSLALSCRSRSLFSRLFAIVPSAAITRAASALDNSFEDISWFLRISTPSANPEDGEGDLHGLPNTAQNEPILFLIWAGIASLHTGTPAVRTDAAANLASIARDNVHYAKRIIEEEGVPPLLRLLKEGTDDGREAAARALGYIARDAESVERLIQAGACAALTQALMNPPMRVQAQAAWAIGELADHGPACQDLFAQSNAVRLLVGHIAFETIQDHKLYTVPATLTGKKSLHSVVLASIRDNAGGSSSVEKPRAAAAATMGYQPPRLNHFDPQLVHSAMAASALNGPAASPGRALVGGRARPRESEDPETKTKMKAMAAYALWKLSAGNTAMCKSITEFRALLSFAALLERSPSPEVKCYSAMALMEIARAAEQSLPLRQSAFKPTSHPARAVVEQLLKVVTHPEQEDSQLLLPCITTLGCLARTFTAREERIVPPLVKLLDADVDPGVVREAAVALTKFACKENYLCVMHCRAIVAAGGTRHILQLVYLGDEAQMDALILLCCLAVSIPESEELAEAGVLAVLLWANQSLMANDPRAEALLPEATAKLELFQSRAGR